MTEGNRNRREPEKQGATRIARDELHAGAGKLDQEPRRPVIPEMVLAIVVETKATIVKREQRRLSRQTPFSDNVLKGRLASKS